VLGLATTPCLTFVDNKAFDGDQTSVMLFEDSHDHHGDCEICSPFCYCFCCQSLFEIAKKEFDFSESRRYSVDISLLVEDPRNPIILYWRPPKI
jgi:hypothetical protein